jgi:hypothetical protein
MTEYFLLKQDARYTNVPVLTGLLDCMDRRDVNIQNADKIPQDTVIYANCAADCDTPGVLDRDLFLVSEGVREVLLFYDPFLIIKNVMLIDLERERQFMYFMPIFEYIDCLGPSSLYTAGGGILKPVLKPESVKGRSTFRIGESANQRPVIRLDVAESLMRRGITDLKTDRVASEDC